MHTPRWPGVALLMVGVLLLQIAWIATVPAFRGSDEFDHAYRASGVAHGQWELNERPLGGRGELVFVPRDLVAAANAQCEALRYTDFANCNPIADGPGDLVGVTTAAGSYNPLYYWVVGNVGQAFDGSTSLYAMRVVSALLCLGLILMAAWCASPLLSGKWSRLGLLAGLTPTFVYSTGVLAPNGLEMAAGLAVWASLIGLGAAGASHEPSLRTERWLFAVAAASGAVLVTLRTLGPLWLLMIVACCAVVHGTRAVVAVVRRHWVAFGGTMAIVAAATLAALWSGTRGALVQDGESIPHWTMALRVPEWTIGALGAFPYRNQPAPASAIAPALLVLLAVLALGTWKARGQAKIGLLVGIAASILGPVAIVAATLSQTGGGWQGRYALPFMVGVVPLAGMMVDLSGWQPPLGPRSWMVIGSGLLVGAQCISVVSVLRAEQAWDASRLDASWHQPSELTLVLLMLAAGGCLAAYVVKGCSPRAVAG